MFKQGIKNFFSGLKFFFTPIGVMAFGAMIGLTIAVPEIVDAVKEMVAEIAEKSDNFFVDWNIAKSSISGSVSALNWGNPSDALNNVFSEQWLNSTFTDCLTAMFGNIEEMIEQIKGIIDVCAQKVMINLIIFGVFLALGIIGGYVFVRYQIRRKIAKRPFLQGLTFLLVHIFLNALITYFLLQVISNLDVGTILSVVLLIVVFGFMTLIEAYVIFAWGKLKIYEVLNIRNILSLVLVNATIILLSFVVPALIFFATHKIGISVFLAIPFVSIGLAVMSLNAESYVLKMVEEKKATPTFDVLNENAASTEQTDEQRSN